MSKQAKLTPGGYFNFLGGLRGKFLLRRVAKGLSRLRRVASEGSPKVKKTDDFTAIKAQNAL